jgi:hypothetical protein
MTSGILFLGREPLRVAGMAGCDYSGAKATPNPSPEVPCSTTRSP